MIYFESLIYKDYWREVALFLAGLRRPNEKADLVARAKEADSQATSGDIQNGRTIVLQLLREGVLSQPRHVQTEAMRYAIGFLEERILRLQRSPEEVLDTLAELAKLYESDETYRSIVDAVRGVSRSSDHGLVSLMHRVAGNALSSDQYVELVLDYVGSAPETRGLVRVGRPLCVPDVIEELASNYTYWEGIPAHVFARRLWSYATRKGIVPDIVYPFGGHLSLVVQFAVGYSNIGRQPDTVVRARGESVPAIWKLHQNVQLVRGWPMDENEGTTYYRSHIGGKQPKTWSWNNGRDETLPKELRQCIGELIDGSDNFIAALQDGRKKEKGRRFLAYLKDIRRWLEEPGIVAWVAARCAAELFRSAALAQRDLGPNKLSDDILEILHRLYRVPDMQSPRNMYFIERFGFGMPLTIRLARGSEMLPLHQVMADFALGRMELKYKADLSWFGELPFPPLLINSLIDLCRGEMEAILRFIGSRAVPIGPFYYGERRVRVQDTRRILKIARQTNEPSVLRGAAAVLINAKFARLADQKLVRKILVASPGSPLVMRVFSTHDSIRSREQEPELRELAGKLRL